VATESDTRDWGFYALKSAEITFVTLYTPRLGAVIRVSQGFSWVIRIPYFHERRVEPVTKVFMAPLKPL